MPSRSHQYFAGLLGRNRIELDEEKTGLIREGGGDEGRLWGYGGDTLTEYNLIKVRERGDRRLLSLCPWPAPHLALIREKRVTEGINSFYLLIKRWQRACPAAAQAASAPALNSTFTSFVW
ncbi:hypothetical protein EVAR_52957_1 [Eumeta japonica]|uniref:Uncharacterized protein n=1 Tax=Eumeta variegata TaxID=151549 RepID=A0A4C1YZB7_EUMVA|nr:hypothetical protein EVAR_52957_1 [Eumeta japonica]